MSTKSKGLERLMGQMYEHMNSAKGRYEEFSNIEKIMFAQQAFNNVNEYCSTKWNYKPESVPFGFIIGHNCAAAAFPRYGSVVANLSYILRTKDPSKIYETFLHEKRHIRQFKTKETTTKVERLFGAFIRGKDGTQSRAQWNASPMEIQADNFAYKHLIKVNKSMLKNPETRVQAAQNIRELRVARVKNAFEHVKGIARVVANPILGPLQKLFGRDKSNEQRVGSRHADGPRVLNLKELTEVFLRNPNNFSGKFNPTDSPIIRSFIASRNDVAHYTENFFGVNRQYNQTMSQQALQQFQKGQSSAENNLINPQEFSQNPEDVDKDLSLNARPVSDEEDEIVVEGTENQAANGNPTLKDEIINNIIASKTAYKENETVATEVNATLDTSASSAISTEGVIAESFVEASVDMGGMTQ